MPICGNSAGVRPPAASLASGPSCRTGGGLIGSQNSLSIGVYCLRKPFLRLCDLRS